MYKKIIFTILICFTFFTNISMANVDYTSNLTEKRIEYIMNKSNPKLTEAEKQAYKRSIIKHSKTYSICPVFVASMIHRESNFRKKLVSTANCRGAMQVGFYWWKPECRKIGIYSAQELHNIDKGIQAGCYIYKYYLTQSKGNVKKALKKYNGDLSRGESKYIRDIFRMRDNAMAIKA